MQDNKQTRRAKKREIFCTTSVQGMGWIDAPTRAISKCDVVEPLPPKFFIPEEGEPVADIYQYPEPILVGNDETRVQCPGGSSGNPVTVGADTYVSPLPWSAAGSLENWQIRHLNTLDLSTLGQWMKEYGDSVSELVNKFHFSIPQAQAFSTEYLDIRQSLGEFTLKQANSLLDCLFRSREVTVSCEPDTMVVTDQCLGQLRFIRAGAPVTIPEGARTSYISQEEADGLAESDARNSLVCTYTNADPFTIDCCDPSKDNTSVPYIFNVIRDGDAVVIGVGEMSGDTPEIIAVNINNIRQFVMNCRCEVDSRSPISGGVADLLGVLHAVKCEDIITILDDTESPDVCNKPYTCACPPDAKPLTLTIPACAIREETQEKADAEAKSQCEEDILCQWCNDEQKGTCDPGSVLITQGIVAAGEVCSFESKAEANAEAKDLADQRTVCGEPCEKDCFCATREEAEARIAGMDMANASEERKASIKDRLTPCGVTPLPWPCTPPAHTARMNLANGIGTTVAKSTAQAMYDACVAKRNEILAATVVFCGPGESVCWEIPPTEADLECDSGCDCMTDAQATASLLAPQRCRATPCGVAKEGDISAPTYCYKGLDINIPDPPPDGDDGGGDPTGVCPTGCDCLTNAQVAAKCPDAKKCSGVECAYTPGDPESSAYCYECKDSSGSGKTAIVHSKLSKAGYRKWWAVEGPDLRFEAVIELTLYSSLSYYPIDERFTEAVVAGTLVVVGAVSELPESIGASVDEKDQFIRISTASSKQQKVVLKLSGIRKGFIGVNYDEATAEEYTINEAFLRQSQP